VKIRKMTATFGALEKAVLTPGPGLTLIEAPNEAGKSTWTAFLRAMFYGFPARDRDRAGYVAEKNRYQPWSGAAMEGTVELEWKGRELTLYRGPKGSVVWGSFSAVWTASQEPVEGLTGENCGEVLLGVSREVFERTAFVGQGGMFLSPSGDLEKRVAALASSGEEEVSYSQVERRLMDWRNRRRSNARNGLIPRLEEELARVEAARERQEGLLRQLQAARREKEELERRRQALSGELQRQAEAHRDVQLQRREQAAAGFEAAQAAFEAAEKAAQALPPAEELRRAQGDLSYLNTLSANLRIAEKAVPEAHQAAEKAREEAEADPWFGGQDPAQAAAKAQMDRDEAARLGKKAPSLLSLLGAPVGSVLGFVLSREAQGRLYSLPLLILGALIGWALVALPMFLAGRSRQKKREALLKRYGVDEPEEILTRAADYSKKYAAAQEAQRNAQAVETERDKLSAQRDELTVQLLDLVHTFAPEVTNLFGVSAALTRALQQGEERALTRERLEAARRLLTALPAPAPGEAVALGSQAAAQLNEVNRELERSGAAVARLQGELASQGDPAELEARRDALLEGLEKRRGEYDALTAALESLKTADGFLRERFSPAVNAKAGAYLSALTEGRYDRAALTRQFQALAQEAGGSAPRQDLVLSGGTAQQLYLAVRLAMCELALPAEEPCPIILDDVLALFDDQRAQLALDCLLEEAKGRQVLLFTCHSREKEMLAGRGAVVAGV